jgi:protein-tyrosine sulfotransferase
MSENKNTLNSPVFICGIHKSGTTLLRNLLDGHPALEVLPIESHFLQKMGFGIDYYFRRQTKRTVSIAEFKESTAMLIEQYNRTNNTLKSDAQLKGQFDVAAFETYLDSHLNEQASLAETFLAYRNGILISLGIKPDEQKRVVEKSVENGELATAYKRIFPQAKFLHIIRNPYSNLTSLRKFKSKGGYPLLPPLVDVIKKNLFHAEKNQFLLGEDYWVIRYEDILNEPISSMNEIANFLQISYTDGMLKPTTLGRPWKGNSGFYENGFEGINNRTLSTWEKRIYPLEVFYINRFLSSQLNGMGYDSFGEEIALHQFLRPIKGEDPKTYLLNRVFRGYPLL